VEAVSAESSLDFSPKSVVKLWTEVQATVP
jgi:hypothetical protein